MDAITITLCSIFSSLVAFSMWSKVILMLLLVVCRGTILITNRLLIFVVSFFSQVHSNISSICIDGKRQKCISRLTLSQFCWWGGRHDLLKERNIRNFSLSSVNFWHLFINSWYSQYVLNNERWGPVESLFCKE